LLQSGASDRWFFIRYSDPEWHLRLRVHGLPERLHREVLPALADSVNSLLDDGRLWRVQFDTYEREVERYGGADGILLAEQLFHVDSEVALELIEMLEPGDEGADERWRLTLYGVDLLLNDFGLDLNSKLRVLKEVRDAFAKELRTDKSLIAQLSEKFRKERRSLEKLLAASNDSEHPLAPGLAVLHRRSVQVAPIVAELKACEETGRLSGSIAELLPSYVHMHANRLLRSDQRRQEFVIYDLLVRVYESLLARARSEPGEVRREQGD
jgi:thiopeptide-type bacteriocin biosynthesis protein